MTRDEIALLLDPAREQKSWWHKNAHWCNTRERWVDAGEPCLSIPDFATDDIAAFKELVPVLLAAGCHIHLYSEGARIIYLGTCVSNCNYTLVPFAAACVAAIAHLARHEPETLARAVKEVRDGK